MVLFLYIQGSTPWWRRKIRVDTKSAVGRGVSKSPSLMRTGRPVMQFSGCLVRQSWLATCPCRQTHICQRCSAGICREWGSHTYQQYSKPTRSDAGFGCPLPRIGHDHESSSLRNRSSIQGPSPGLHREFTIEDTL